ncbi:MAG: hypothetical protein M9894_04705 [Planctomycetes bacterium]|nr:hypothetical protein [Planctomycetota bacterium]
MSERTRRQESGRSEVIRHDGGACVVATERVDADGVAWISFSRYDDPGVESEEARRLPSSS